MEHQNRQCSVSSLRGNPAGDFRARMTDCWSSDAAGEASGSASPLEPRAPRARHHQRHGDFPKSLTVRIVRCNSASGCVVKEVIVAGAQTGLLVLGVMNSRRVIDRANDNLTGQGGGVNVRILSPNKLFDVRIAHFTTEMLYRIFHKLPDWWAHKS